MTDTERTRLNELVSALSVNRVLTDEEVVELADLTSKVFVMIDFKYYPYFVADHASDICTKCKKIKEHYE